MTLILGWFWSSFLTFPAALLITPFAELEQAARKAASGDIHENVKMTKSGDEQRRLSLAYNIMLSSLRKNNFDETNEKVSEINPHQKPHPIKQRTSPRR